MGIEVFIKLAASLAGLIMAITKFKEVQQNPHKELMDHIRVQEQLSETSKHYSNVSARIDRLLSRLYPDPKVDVAEISNEDSTPVKRDWKLVKEMLFMSVISFVLFSWWTFWILTTKFSLWVLLTGLMALTSFALFKAAIEACLAEINRKSVT
ncbi:MULTISPECIES: hypothetical protein [Vibrio]|uniref:hypothetical protein n=1 Tax=Vibrio TaxID=662 RepID=UPI0005867871|nr:MULTISPECIES: hypothetical protein [Vibrio]MCM5511646.1 hypothetical protein [Vibrio sp. SCSIO 43169]MDE3896045.1 hypothetical protein [Vibrio sp. CC007]